MPRKTKQTSTNTYGYMTPPSTAATQNLQAMVDTPVDYATPIRNSYARAEAKHQRSYNSPLGAYTTADVRDKQQRAYHNENQQNLGLALSDAAQQTAGDKFNRQATVVGFTQPRLVQTGGSATTHQPFSWMDALNIGGGAATGVLA